MVGSCYREPPVCAIRNRTLGLSGPNRRFPFQYAAGFADLNFDSNKGSNSCLRAARWGKSRGRTPFSPQTDPARRCLSCLSACRGGEDNEARCRSQPRQVDAQYRLDAILTMTFVELTWKDKPDRTVDPVR